MTCETVECDRSDCIPLHVIWNGYSRSFTVMLTKVTNNVEPHRIAKSFFSEQTVLSVEELGDGLINTTYLVKFEAAESVVLQRINTAVFPNPTAILENIVAVGSWLAAQDYDYQFPFPIKHPQGGFCFTEKKATWRMMPYYAGAFSPSVVVDASMAFRAGKCIGHFHACMDGFDVAQLQTILPNFHAGKRRLDELKEAFQQPLIQITDEIRMLAEEVLQHEHILLEFDDLQRQLPIRVIHHDTKIGNFLFDEKTMAVCALIDLDTLMPGTILSDVGDMIRSYANPSGEDAENATAVVLDQAMIDAILEGYLLEMEEKLTPLEKDALIFSGVALAYMQAVRFLTDHLLGNRYYHVQATGQNFSRARNQLVLFRQLLNYDQG